MTPELLQRGRNFRVFVEEILGVKLNPAQLRWADSFTQDGNWTAHGSVWVSGNQVGKSVGVAMLILWATIYKIGLRNDNPATWLTTPYQWFHVAPTQQQAYIPLHDIRLLVKNAHPAQDVGKEQYGLTPQFPEQLVIFQKMENYYDGFETVMGGSAQFRTTEEKAKALQGRRAHGISFDEAAFEPHLISVMYEALMMRLISTGGPIIVVSTPNGINDFYELVEGILERAELVPGYQGLSWKTEDGWAVIRSSVADNDGFGLSHEEILRKEAELDPATKEQQLRGEFLTPTEAYFVPPKLIIEAFTDLPEHVDPTPGRTYIISWDPSIASDPTAAVVLDISSAPWRGVHQVWDRKPPGLQSLLSNMYGLHHRYSVGSAITIFDKTGMGGKIISEQLMDLRPQKGLELAGNNNIKLQMLANLRAALSTKKLVLPQAWTGVRREILNYRLDDKTIQNDRVMALAMAAWIASKGYGGSVTPVDFRVAGRISRSTWR